MASLLDEAADMLEAQAPTASAALTVKQVAAYLQISYRSTWRLIEQGKLRVVHVNTRTTRVLRRDLDEFIQRCST